MNAMMESTDTKPPSQSPSPIPESHPIPSWDATGEPGIHFPEYKELFQGDKYETQETMHNADKYVGRAKYRYSHPQGGNHTVKVGHRG